MNGSRNWLSNFSAAAVLFLRSLKERQGCGSRLHADVLPGKVSKLLDAGVFGDDDDLAVVYIGNRELIIVLTAISCETVPDAVDGAGIELHVLGVPVDRLLLQLPAFHLANLLCQLKVEAGVLTVIVHVAVRRILRIETDGQNAVLNARRDILYRGLGGFSGFHRGCYA